MFSGTIVALVTPFTKENRVNFSALEKLIERQIEHGIDGIVCLGTTGEAPTLTRLEKRSIIDCFVSTVDKRVPLIVGTGTNCTASTVENTLAAKKLGADGALVITPYYNKPTMRGCFEHFKSVNDVELPLILYHHPPRTGVTLTFEWIEKMCSLDYVAGVKECSSNLKLMKSLCQLPSISIFTGNDDEILETMREGADGVISASANVIPKEMIELLDYAKKGNWREAEALYGEISPLIRALFKEVNPQGIKYALSLLGHTEPYMRLPLIMPEEETRSSIEKALLKTVEN